MNCWEFKKCGREPGGSKVAELGICPAATTDIVNGINNGKNGGRCCWAIAGTFCGGNIQGSYSAKLSSCTKCEFYSKVWKEEKAKNNYADALQIIRAMKNGK